MAVAATPDASRPTRVSNRGPDIQSLSLNFRPTVVLGAGRAVFAPRRFAQPARGRRVPVASPQSPNASEESPPLPTTRRQFLRTGAPFAAAVILAPDASARVPA